jgi:cell division protease FtsH
MRAHRDKLDMMAARLLTAEVVEEEEITRLWGPKVTRPGTIDGRGHEEAPPESPNLPAASGAERQVWRVPQAVADAHDGEPR